MKTKDYYPLYPSYRNDEGPGREISEQDGAQEWYDLISGEWEQWRHASEGEEFDVLDTLDKMGFFGLLDTKGQRLYSDDALQACVDDSGGERQDKLFDIFFAEANRRATEKKAELQKEVSTVKRIELDAMILPPGEGSIEPGEGGRRVEQKELHPRKQLLVELLENLQISYIQAPMKLKRNLSREVRDAVERSVRGSQHTSADETSRAMYDLFIIREKKLSVFVSDLHGEGTHVLFVDPLAEVKTPTEEEMQEAIEAFVKKVGRKEDMNSSEYLHHMVRYTTDVAWQETMRTLLNNIEDVKQLLIETKGL